MKLTFNQTNVELKYEKGYVNLQVLKLLIRLM